MSIVVAQLGARMHYAVPRILHREGLLEYFFTDVCATKGWPRLMGVLPPRLQPARVRRLMNRIPVGVPAKLTTAFTGFGVDYARRIVRARNTDERNAAFLWSGKEFGRRVIGKGFGAAKAVYVFNSAGLEILQEARRRGLRGIVEQTIAPRIIESAILQEESVCFPDWEAPTEHSSLMQEYCARESNEWNEADLIVCGSQYVKDGVVASGGKEDRCVVVPYGLESAPSSRARTERRPGPLRVLTVGAICLRKGSPYVLAAARKLGKEVVFRMVGPIQVLPGIEKELREHVELRGIVPRMEMAEHYDWADVFLLPSLCEGSATVTYEAMTHGLPVVCTYQTGSTVQDGVDGFIVPSRSAEAIADKLGKLASDSSLLESMSQNARRNSAQFTLDKYGERLIACFRERNLI
jgi:hypothetical protein